MEVQNAFRYWKISLTDAELRRMIEKVRLRLRLTSTGPYSYSNNTHITLVPGAPYHCHYYSLSGYTYSPTSIHAFIYQSINSLIIIESSPSTSTPTQQYADEEQEGIDFPEFIAMIEKKKQATKLEKGYAENFKKYDVGNNGFLSEKNLLKALKKFDYLNCDTDTVQLLDLTLMVNKDKDGNFNFRDYIQVLRSKGVLK